MRSRVRLNWARILSQLLRSEGAARSASARGSGEGPASIPVLNNNPVRTRKFLRFMSSVSFYAPRRTARYSPSLLEEHFSFLQVRSVKFFREPRIDIG